MFRRCRVSPCRGKRPLAYVRLAEERLTGVSCPIHCEIFDLGPRPAALVSSSLDFVCAVLVDFAVGLDFVPGEAVPWANSGSRWRARDIFYVTLQSVAAECLVGYGKRDSAIECAVGEFCGEVSGLGGERCRRRAARVYTCPPTASPSANSYTSFAEPSVTSTAYSSDLLML